MPLNQLSAFADRVMNKISVKISKAEAKIQEGTKEKNEAWDEAINIFREFNKEPGKARFIAKDGHTVNWTQRAGKTKLFAEALWGNLVAEYGTENAGSIWEKITTRQVDSDLLEKAMHEGLVSQDIIEASIETADPVTVRLHEEWTKQDKERAVIYGIERSVTEESTPVRS